MEIKVSVIGSGAWGTTLAHIISKKGIATAIWSYEKEVAESINLDLENKKYLPGIKLSKNLTADTDLNALMKADIIISAIPTQFLRSSFSGWSVKSGTVILSASKGIEKGSLLLPTQILEGLLHVQNIAALSGPNLSREIAQGLPSASVVACKDPSAAKKIQEILSGETFRVYTADDVIGAEIGGALKNVIAIAAGICDGLKLGNNSKSALIVRGMAEIKRLGIALGAKPDTFAGLSGMGDLITTCASELSRNHFVGNCIAGGKTLQEVASLMNGIAEGVETTVAAIALSTKMGIEMPITQEVNKVLFAGKDPKEAMLSLMTRSLKSE